MSASADAVGQSGVWALMDAYRCVVAGASVADLAGTGGAAYYLRTLALESAIMGRIRARVTVGIHRALSAGASLAEVAEALGAQPGQVACRWAAWARGQRALWERTGLLGLSGDEYARIAAALGAAVDGAEQPRRQAEWRADK